MKTNHFLSLLAVFAIALAFFACSSDPEPSPPPPSDPSSDSSGGQMVFCKLTAGTCSQMSLSTCMELVSAGAAAIVSNCDAEPPPPSSSSVAPPPLPSSSSSAPRPSSSSTAPTPGIEQCNGYCKWPDGCFRIATDPTGQYGSVISSCTEAISNCQTNGQFFSNSTCSSSTPSSSSLTPLSSSATSWGAFVDGRDGNAYIWVKIGTQTWMGENLNYNVNGSRCPNNVANNCITYGRQYDWATAMGIAASYNSTSYGTVTRIKGICPTDWHLPSAAEWSTLQSYVGTTPGTKLKATHGWNNNANGTDTYGFEALPGGYVCYKCDTGIIIDSDTYLYIGDKGLWWTATEYNAGYAYNRAMDGGSSILRYGIESYDYAMSKNNMLSVRCVKD